MSTASQAQIAANRAGRVSVARLEANKANALKATGPRTPEGKARVSQNALTHGLRSERNPLDLATDAALPFEIEEFQTTLAAFTDDLRPSGPLETRLVERLVQIDLRLSRALRMETTHLHMHAIQTQTEAAAAGSSLATDTDRTRDNFILTISFLRNPSALKLVNQYESRLARDFARTLSLFRQSQALRAKRDGQKLGNQTQPAPSASEKPQHATDGPGSILAQHPSDDCRVAELPASIAFPSSPLKEVVEQTQLCPPPVSASSTKHGQPTTAEPVEQQGATGV